jgi:hypothetical protein
MKVLQILIIGCFLSTAFTCKNNLSAAKIYHDQPFIQEYSVRYYSNSGSPLDLLSVFADRNGKIQVLTSRGPSIPNHGSFLYPGSLTSDIAYPPMLKRNISGMTEFQHQFVYLDQNQVFSNTWAGKIQIDHHVTHPKMIVAGNEFCFMVSDGNLVKYIDQTGKVLWSGTFPRLKQIKFQTGKNRFFLVGTTQISAFTPGQNITEIYSGANITCAEPLKNSDQIAVGTTNGYLILPDKQPETKFPATDINCITEIDGNLWFGTSQGAFRKNENGKYNYYAGERWLPSNQVTDISKGPDGTVLILTSRGLAQIYFEPMTLEEKALFFEKQVRLKNIRYGFNCSSVQLPDGYSSAALDNQPSEMHFGILFMRWFQARKIPTWKIPSASFNNTRSTCVTGG